MELPPLPMSALWGEQLARTFWRISVPTAKWKRHRIYVTAQGHSYLWTLFVVMAKIKKKGNCSPKVIDAKLTEARRIWPGQKLHHKNSSRSQTPDNPTWFPKTMHIQRFNVCNPSLRLSDITPQAYTLENQETRRKRRNPPLRPLLFTTPKIFNTSYTSLFSTSFEIIRH